MSTHKAIATTAEGVLDEINVPTVQPQEGQVLVKNEYCAATAYDTYTVDSRYIAQNYPMPLGLNGSGTVVRVGPGVDHLKVGDRVVAFAIGPDAQGKSMQEYSLHSKYSVSKIPDTLSIQDAATIPDNFVSAYYALFSTLLPLPESLPATSPPKEASTPILVYGSGTIVGQNTIQVLKLAGYTRILTTSSAKHHEYLKSLGATETFDYSKPDLAKNILAATSGQPVKYVVDGVTAEHTLQQIAKVVGKGSTVAMFVPIKEGSSVTAAPGSQMWMELPKDRIAFPEGAEAVPILSFNFLQNPKIRDTLLPKTLPKLLSSGLLKPSRVRLIEGDTFKRRVETALDLIRNNKISGEKAVIKVSG